ncbi:MAG TPA: dTMP kinase [Burkholderiales bacterium]|nr:dTMP kinase [Burkholderiales bacterium]
MKRGLFITFEGIDGAGKSTQLEWAADFLRGLGLALVRTREPGGTPLGEKIRETLLRAEKHVDAETESLLVFAARRQHLEEIIRPALARGECVLCDRFTDATFAYQGGGSGVDKRKLDALEQWVHPDLQPDLTVLFDVSAEVGRSRVARIKSPDRFEREGAEFFTRVREAYLDRLRHSGGRMVRIDGTRAIAQVQAELGATLEKAVGKWKS